METIEKLGARQSCRRVCRMSPIKGGNGKGYLAMLADYSSRGPTCGRGPWGRGPAKFFLIDTTPASVDCRFGVRKMGRPGSCATLR